MKTTKTTKEEKQLKIRFKQEDLDEFTDHCDLSITLTLNKMLKKFNEDKMFRREIQESIY